MRRRRFLQQIAAFLGALGLPAARSEAGRIEPLTLFLCGDVMLGRGIDQIQPRSTDPRLYEPFLTDAREYIALAEAANGPIPRPADASYIWGELLDELGSAAPAVRIVNLENAITARGEAWANKGIHYRMHPHNVRLLERAGVDCCVLANNHVLDWGPVGLTDTIEALARVGIRSVGAGPNLRSAGAPAVVPAGAGRRVKVVALASVTSGVPRAWQAGPRRAGVNLIADDPSLAVESVLRAIGRRRPGDVVVVSIHWGGNWGYEIPDSQRRLAHALIDTGSVDVVHGHSAHHPKGIERYRGRLVLYGCGDLINDYEGIRGHEAYRTELRLAFFVSLDPTTGALRDLRIAPMRVARFRLHRATPGETEWLLRTLNREGGPLGTRFVIDPQGRIALDLDGT